MRRILNAFARSPVLIGALVFCWGCATSPTGRKQLMLVPAGQMSALGAQSFAEMKSEIPIDRDPKTNRYVDCVAQPLTKVAGPELDIKKWEIVVFKDDTANAFALPGGKIGVHTGLLKVAKNDAQLAAVLGHEIGHVIAGHSNERVSENLVAQGGLAAIGAFIGGDNTKKDILMGLLGVGTQYGVLLPHGRTQESEADLIGLDLMARAGFDPRQSVELWKNMMQAEGGGAPPEFLSTHPASANRISNLQAHMADAMTKYERAKAGQPRAACVR